MGFSDSGTWKTLTPNEGGNFVVDQGVLRFYGTYGGGLYIENHYAPVPDKGTTGWFDVWNAGLPPLTALRDGTISMTKNCAGG